MTVNDIWPFYKIGSIFHNLESPGKYTYVSSKYLYVHINIQSFIYIFQSSKWLGMRSVYKYLLYA